MTTIVDRIDSPAAADRIRDDDFLADKKRFESFKLGGAVPSSQPRRHSHSRSHSRNLSVSIPTSPSLPLSLSSFHDISLSSTSSSISSLSQLGSAPTKRISHHRRCSSVSTRRESAEVMGVTLPALSASNSEDNMALGDKDSIRRRALWALEGKSSPDGFSPVEIPELSTPEIERRIFELPSKPSFPPALGSFSSGLSGLANMRDTFGNRMSSSLKDQLHTLVEEEEEEEEPDVPSSPLVLSPCEPPAEEGALPGSVTTSPTPTRTRPRPACLSLRPLSLSPEKFKSAPNGELSTPAPTSTPSKSSGLKSLTLTSSPNVISSPPTLDGVLSDVSALHRRSVVVLPPHPASTPFFRRPSLTDSASSGFSDPFELPKKRSSISYKSSFHGLPTPELTPTTDRRASTGSDSDWGRPSSITHEQHFLYQSQAALVARISELERTLSSRTHSRPASVAASDASSSAPEPTDEMLRLISDLKAERDELKRDVNGWRTRVADLERQTGALALRVDTERREAWIARERLGLIEMEKRAALRVAEESEVAVVNLQAELATTKADFQVAQEVVERSREEVAHELDRIKVTLAEERKRREELEKVLEELRLSKTPTPVVPTNRVVSIDSMASTTDVESLDDKLKAVEEVVEEVQGPYSDQENNLIGYEDEEEGDESFISHDDSFCSLDDFPRSTSHLMPCVASSPSHTSTPASVSTHVRHSSLSREWSFPAKGGLHSSPPQPVPEEVDRFFGCLEDVGDSPPMSDSATPQATNPFSRGLFGAVEDEGDELPPFVLPADVGIEVEFSPVQDSAQSAGLGLCVVPEEEEEPEGFSITEDEFVGEEYEGGIKFTFNIPPAFASPVSSQTPSPTTPPEHTPLAPPKSVPYYEPAIENDDDDSPLTFPTAPLVSCTGASPTQSPSGIPRATALRRFEGPAKDAKSSPPRVALSPPAALPHIALSSKRGGVRPSFIPQPVAKTGVAVPTFIPQPATKARACSSITAAQAHSQPPSGEVAVSPSSTNTDASVSSSHPFAALQNLAKFMPPLASPFSWSSSGIRAVASSEGGLSVEGKTNNKGEQEQKGFVSKERQLARLRERMAAGEGVVMVQGRVAQQQQPVPVLPCRRCVDRIVSP